MKRVYTSQDGFLIDYLQRLLEEEGVPCMQRNRYLSGGAGELPPGECWPELWIMNDADVDRARSHVDQVVATRDPPAENWNCPACGESIEGQYGICWNCGFSDTPGG